MNDLEKLCPKFLQTPNAAGIIAFLFNEFMNLEMRMAVPGAVASQIKQREEQILESVQQDYSYALQHPDDEAVDRFAQAMKQKLAQARERGRSGWQQMNPNELSGMLYEHVAKGDPRDVANFCMFLWNLGHSIKAAKPIDADESMWCRYIASMIGEYLGERLGSDKEKAIAGIIERRLWNLPKKEAPAVAQEPDGWHFKFNSGAEAFVTNIDAADLIKLNLQKGEVCTEYSKQAPVAELGISKMETTTEAAKKGGV